MSYVHTMEHNSDVCYNMKNTEDELSEISQMQKDKYCDPTYMNT